MRQSPRSITSSDAKASFGELLASLPARGAIEITRNGRAVGLLTLPQEDYRERDGARLSALASGYAKGEVTWRQIASELNIGFGDLLIELGRQNLSLPRVIAKKSDAQAAWLEKLLDDAQAGRGQ